MLLQAISTEGKRREVLVALLVLIAVDVLACRPADNVEGKKWTSKAASESLPGPPEPLEIPDALLETLEQGGPNEAAQALMTLIPDGRALIYRHEEVAHSAGAAQGEMNLETLRKACPLYHRWHARAILKDPARPRAILAWMGQKVWETPQGAAKEEAVRLLVADISAAIDTGVLAPEAGLGLVRQSVMEMESVRPGVSVVPLADLLKRYADASDPRLRAYVFAWLVDLGHVADERTFDREDLFAFLKRHYPERSFPKRADELFFPPAPRRARGMDWEEYEKLPALPLGELVKELDSCDCGNYQALRSCNMAGLHLLAQYELHPEETETLVVSLMKGGHLSPSSVLRGIWDEEVEYREEGAHQVATAKAASCEKWVGLLDAMAASAENSLHEGGVKTVEDARSIAWSGLTLAAAMSGKEDTPAIRELEIRLLDLLFETGDVWVELKNHGAEDVRYFPPFNNLWEVQGKLSPEAEAHLQELAQQTLAKLPAPPAPTGEAQEMVREALEKVLQSSRKRSANPTGETAVEP